MGSRKSGVERSAGETNLRASQHRESHDELSEMTILFQIRRKKMQRLESRSVNK